VTVVMVLAASYFTGSGDWKSVQMQKFLFLPLNFTDSLLLELLFNDDR
jgi:hypothetical protein